jgi:hypothetical protein
VNTYPRATGQVCQSSDQANRAGADQHGDPGEMEWDDAMPASLTLTDKHISTLDSRYFDINRK